MGAENGFTAATSLAQTEYLRGITSSPESVRIQKRLCIPGGYGSISITGGSGSQALSADTETAIDQWDTDGNALECTPGQPNDIVIDQDGKWWAVCALDDWTGQASTSHIFRVRQGGTPIATRTVATDGSGQGPGLTLRADITATATDVIDVSVESVGSTSTFVLKEATLTVDQKEL